MTTDARIAANDPVGFRYHPGRISGATRPRFGGEAQ
jgi:hypothetical protein